MFRTLVGRWVSIYAGVLPNELLTAYTMADWTNTHLTEWPSGRMLKLLSPNICRIALEWMLQNTFDDKTTAVRVMLTLFNVAIWRHYALRSLSINLWKWKFIHTYRAIIGVDGVIVICKVHENTCIHNARKVEQQWFIFDVFHHYKWS